MKFNHRVLIPVGGSILSALFLIMCLVYIKKVLPIHVGPNCDVLINRVYKPMNINGKVVKKQRDRDNHGIETVFIRYIDGSISCFTNADEDSLDMYNFFQVGDSIVKTYGSLSIKLSGVRNNKLLDTTKHVLCINPLPYFFNKDTQKIEIAQ